MYFPIAQIYIHFVRIIESRTFSTEQDGRNPAGPRGLYRVLLSTVPSGNQRYRVPRVAATQNLLSVGELAAAGGFSLGSVRGQSAVRRDGGR